MLFCKDARDEFLSPESVDLFFTHPPYFHTNYPLYGGDQARQLNNTSQDATQYMDNMLQAVKSMEKALKPTGSLLIILPNVRTGLEIMARIINETELIAEKTFIWDYKQSWFVKQVKGEEHAIILHLHKGTPYIDMSIIDNFIVTLPWNPSSPDIKDYEHLGFVYDSFPEELAAHFIPIFSRPGDVVVDLFGGTGTTCIAAKKLGRNYIYNDLSIDQYAIAEARLNG